MINEFSNVPITPLFVSSAVNGNVTRSVFIGASDGRTDGVWRWVDSRVLQWTDWLDGYPKHVSSLTIITYICISDFLPMLTLTSLPTTCKLYVNTPLLLRINFSPTHLSLRIIYTKTCLTITRINIYRISYQLI